MIFTSSISLLFYLSIINVQAGLVKRAVGGPDCTNIYTDFATSMDGWVEEKGLTDAWRQTTQGIEMRILPPNDKTTKVDIPPESKMLHIWL
jgi:hypothetical protein